LDGIDLHYELLEVMRFWHLNPDNWPKRTDQARTYMIAHYREHSLRKSHADHITRIITEKENSPPSSPKKKG